ncbi:hypothetical protein VC83_02377 [Pseudogymnoascus destructans]|uniref:Uncharacterized protein n=1 Tax=Pseudogymnoascus destructans TaxID=655981 RepID=A0A177AIZ3_9PEZI|nr:uncharacterized protein VC83_02377 [Pseudogymnoascus destructans]OAF61144.1 hypothetical protein VC83_02377 [Pseudogymnoascus destructans]
MNNVDNASNRELDDDKVEGGRIIRTGFMEDEEEEKERRREGEKERRREGEKEEREIEERERERERGRAGRFQGSQLGRNMSDVNDRGGYYGAHTYEVHTTSTTHTHTRING